MFPIRKTLVLLLSLLLIALSLTALAETLSLEEMEDASDAVSGDAISNVTVSSAARDLFIDRILETAETTFRLAGGKPQRAQYSGDIYVCKNFTVYLFRQNCGDFRMAEYPDTPLVIPNNQKKADCAPYAYGVEWQDVTAEAGNPFEIAASFRYDTSLTKEQNREKARELLRQVRRGDYFQMSADYYYGKGAHSMVFSADYDPATNTVHWTDSNMKGKTIGGERYAYVQFNAEKDIDWFVDAFCQKTRGATLYRLREDIILR